MIFHNKLPTLVKILKENGIINYKNLILTEYTRLAENFQYNCRKFIENIMNEKMEVDNSYDSSSLNSAKVIYYLYYLNFKFINFIFLTLGKFNKI